MGGDEESQSIRDFDPKKHGMTGIDDSELTNNIVGLGGLETKKKIDSSKLGDKKKKDKKNKDKKKKKKKEKSSDEEDSKPKESVKGSR